MPAAYVDHSGDAIDLSKFEDHTFKELYASHTLEHFDLSNEVEIVLAEWFRVLIPGGRAYIAVPDLSIIAQLFMQELNMNEQFDVLRMLYGGQIDEFDFHKAGFDFEFLCAFLEHAGFINCTKVKDFGLFNDTSSIVYRGVPISLNVIAEKP